MTVNNYSVVMRKRSLKEPWNTQ